MHTHAPTPIGTPLFFSSLKTRVPSVNGLYCCTFYPSSHPTHARSAHVRVCMEGRTRGNVGLCLCACVLHCNPSSSSLPFSTPPHTFSSAANSKFHPPPALLNLSPTAPEAPPHLPPSGTSSRWQDVCHLWHEQGAWPAWPVAATRPVHRPCLPPPHPVTSDDPSDPVWVPVVTPTPAP